MFYRKPPGLFGPGFNSYDTNNLMTPLVATPRPQPMPQRVTLPNSGYPVLDLISGLSQVFTRPKPTMVGYPDPTPTFPEPQSQGGFGGDSPDYGPSRKRPGGIFDIGFDPGIIEENPQSVQYNEWGKPIKRYPMDERPSPPLRKFPQPLLGQSDVDYAIARQPKPQPGFSIADTFGPAWTDDEGQNKWLDRWGIQPAQDARYLPDYPDAEDNSTGAQIIRNWHDAYKQYAFDRIQENAPQFVEHAPQPQPQQSYGDFMGEVKNTASTLVNRAAGMLGSGIGRAFNFIPGLGAVMELIGKGANIAGTIAGATGLGGEKASTALNLLGSVANGTAGGASAGAEEYGPPMPSADRMPQEKPIFNPRFDIKPGEHFPSPEQIWQKMDEAEAAGLDPYEALGVPRPAEYHGEMHIPPLQEKRFDQATEDTELNLPKPPYPSWPKDQMPPSPFDPNRPPLSKPQAQPEEYGPEMPENIANTPQKPKFIPFDPEKVLPGTGEKASMPVRDAASMVVKPILKAAGFGPLGGPAKKGIDKAHEELTSGSYQQSIAYIDNMIKANRDAGNEDDAQKWEDIKGYRIRQRDSVSHGMPIGTMSDSMYMDMIIKQMNNIGAPKPAPKK